MYTTTEVMYLTLCVLNGGTYLYFLSFLDPAIAQKHEAFPRRRQEANYNIYSK